MSIARAFTTRRGKNSLHGSEVEGAPQRSNTMKGPTGSIRHKISAPVELLHTTNLLSYNAPDIYPKSASSTGSSRRFDDDMSDSAHTNASSPPTSPDIESSPKRSLSPEPNHLSCYFTPPSHMMSPTAEEPKAASPGPVIPQRAPSHTKKTYEASLLRKRSASQISDQSHRSVSSKASFNFSRTSTTSTNTTATSQSTAATRQQKGMKSGSPSIVSLPIPPSPSPGVTIPPTQVETPSRKGYSHSQSQHPFGQELAKVSEIAEEYGVKEQLNEIDAEQKEMARRGLEVHAPKVYLQLVGHPYYLGTAAQLSSPANAPVSTGPWI